MKYLMPTLGAALLATVAHAQTSTGSADFDRALQYVVAQEKATIAATPELLQGYLKQYHCSDYAAAPQSSALIEQAKKELAELKAPTTRTITFSRSEKLGKYDPKTGQIAFDPFSGDIVGLTLRNPLTNSKPKECNPKGDWPASIKLRADNAAPIDGIPMGAQDAQALLARLPGQRATFNVTVSLGGKSLLKHYAETTTTITAATLNDDSGKLIYDFMAHGSARGGTSHNDAAVVSTGSGEASRTIADVEGPSPTTGDSPDTTPAEPKKAEATTEMNTPEAEKKETPADSSNAASPEKTKLAAETATNVQAEPGNAAEADDEKKEAVALNPQNPQEKQWVDMAHGHYTILGIDENSSVQDVLDFAQKMFNQKLSFDPATDSITSPDSKCEKRAEWNNGYILYAKGAQCIRAYFTHGGKKLFGFTIPFTGGGEGEQKLARFQLIRTLATEESRAFAQGADAAVSPVTKYFGWLEMLVRGYGPEITKDRTGLGNNDNPVHMYEVAVSVQPLSQYTMIEETLTLPAWVE